MAQAQHTPGPWRRQVVAPTFDQTSIQTSDGKYSIARVYSKANACLIEAAPELLDGCKSLLAIVEHLQLHPDDVLDEHQQDEIDAARAAIAKAERL